MAAARALLDRHGQAVAVGQCARILQLAGAWVDALPADEKAYIASMVGETFVVEEIDAYG